MPDECRACTPGECGNVDPADVIGDVEGAAGDLGPSLAYANSCDGGDRRQKAAGNMASSRDQFQQDMDGEGREKRGEHKQQPDGNPQSAKQGNRSGDGQCRCHVPGAQSSRSVSRSMRTP